MHCRARGREAHGSAVHHSRADGDAGGLVDEDEGASGAVARVGVDEQLHRRPHGDAAQHTIASMSCVEFGALLTRAIMSPRETST